MKEKRSTGAKWSKGNLRAAKLTPEQVVAIRDAYDAGTTQRELCSLYNVSIGTIGRIVRGETWRVYAGPGEHEGASRPSTDSLMHEQGLEQAALSNAPAINSPEIQASLAKLAQLGIESAAFCVAGGPQGIVTQAEESKDD